MPRGNSAAIQSARLKPVECLKSGWELIKDRYWLFVGMSVVGLLMGSAAMGLLTGP